jgi:hypothetical protein
MFLVECYSDENLLRGLGIPAGSIRRMYGKGNVLNFVSKDAAMPHIALLDKDRNKSQPRALSLFKLEQCSQGVERYAWRKHTLVLLDDYLEDWLVRATKLTGANMSDFKLPATAAELHRIELEVGDERMLKLVRHLVEQRSPALAVLKEALGV